MKDAIDSSLEHLRAWMPWADHEPESVAQKTERIVKFRDAFETRQFLTYGIFPPGERRMIGNISINWRVSPDMADLGYWIRASETGHGYASEAAIGCMFATFLVLGNPSVEIFCDPKNKRSAAIPARLGFSPMEHQPRKTAEGPDRMSQIWRMDRATFSTLHGSTAGFAVRDRQGRLLAPL